MRKICCIEFCCKRFIIKLYANIEHKLKYRFIIIIHAIFSNRSFSILSNHCYWYYLSITTNYIMPHVGIMPMSMISSISHKIHFSYCLIQLQLYNEAFKAIFYIVYCLFLFLLAQISSRLHRLSYIYLSTIILMLWK